MTLSGDCKPASASSDSPPPLLMTQPGWDPCSPCIEQVRCCAFQAGELSSLCLSLKTKGKLLFSSMSNLLLILRQNYPGSLPCLCTDTVGDQIPMDCSISLSWVPQTWHVALSPKCAKNPKCQATLSAGACNRLKRGYCPLGKEAEWLHPELESKFPGSDPQIRLAV